jgi:hypothetical protein
VRSERFELPTLGIEIRCSIQLSYERVLNYIIEIAWFFNMNGSESLAVSCCVCCKKFLLRINECQVLPAAPCDTHATYWSRGSIYPGGGKARRSPVQRAPDPTRTADLRGYAEVDSSPVTPDEMQTLLQAHNIGFSTISHGRQFRLADGAIANVYTSGRVVWQGKDTPTAQKCTVQPGPRSPP